MQWRCWIEDGDQQVITELCIELHTRIDKVTKADVPLYDNQAPGFFRCERSNGEDDLVVNAAAKLPSLPFQDGEPQAISKIDQCLTDLGLEQHNNCDPKIDHGISKNKFKRRKLLGDSQPIEQRQNYHSHHRRHCSCASQKLKYDIHNDKYQRDIEDITQRIYRR